MGQCVPFSEISEHLRKKSDVFRKISNVSWKKSNVFSGTSIVFSRASLALWHFSKKWGDAGGSDGFLEALGRNRGERAEATMGIFQSFEGQKRAMRA